MSIENPVFLIGIIVMFVVYIAVLAWAERRTRGIQDNRTQDNKTQDNSTAVKRPAE